MTFSAHCFICDGYISDSGVSLQLGQTAYSKTELPSKISQLIGVGFMVIVSKDDEICAKCFNLINNADKLEKDLLLVKKEIIEFLRLKYQLAPVKELINTSVQESRRDADSSDAHFHDDSGKGKDVLNSFEVNVTCVKPDETLNQPKEYQFSNRQKDSSPNICDNVKTSSPKVQGIHKCRICGQSFQSQVCVRRHIMYSHLKWTCCYCNINFDKKRLYDLHVKTHSNTISLKSDLKYNMAAAVKHFHCVSCNFKTSEKVEFNNHLCYVLKNNLSSTSRDEFEKHETSNSSFSNLGVTAEPVSVINCGQPVREQNCTKVLSPKTWDWEIEKISSGNFKKSDKLMQTNINKLPITFSKPYKNGNNNDASQTAVNVLAKNNNKGCVLKSNKQSKSGCELKDNYMDGEVRISSKANNSSKDNLLHKPIYHIDMNSLHLNKFLKISQDMGNGDVIIKHQTKTLNSSLTTESEYEVKIDVGNLPPEIGKPICNKENEIKIHTCEICCFNFISEKELKNHIETNHNDIKAICPICFDDFVSVDKMYQHLQELHDCTKTENGIILYTNPTEIKSETKFSKTYEQNNKLLPTKEILKRNIKVHLMDVVQCGLCKIKFKTEKRLENHLLNFHRDLNYKFCGKEMQNIKTIKIHERQHLKNIEHKFQCSKCNKHFKTKGGLKCHYASHTGNFKFCCDFCGRGFMSRMALEEHRSTHTKEERFVCDVCGKKFCLQSTYWIHRKWHDNPFPYKCNYCNRIYKHSSVLAVHKRTHTGDRPYKCPYCSLSFPASGTLKRHLILHTQQFPFNCKICQKGFTTRNKYAKHLAKIHSNFHLLNESSKPKDFKMAINSEPVQIRNDQISESWEFTPDSLFNLSVTSDMVSSVTNEDLNGQILQIFL